MRARTAFTIVEAFIVLAVTSALLFSALAMINGRQGRTQFSTGMREIEVLVRDALNDVGNGVLPDIAGLRCTGSGTNPPVLSYSAISGDTVGRNEQCVMAGKVIQFGTDTEDDLYITYAVAGRRLTLTGDSVRDFPDLRPIVIHPTNAGNNPNVNSKESRKLPWEISVVKADGTAGAAALTLMYRDFRGSNEPGGRITAGNSSIGIAPLVGSTTDGISNAQEGLVLASVSSLALADFYVNDQTMTICFKSGSSNQFGVLNLTSTAIGFDVSSEVLEDLGGKTCYS